MDRNQQPNPTVIDENGLPVIDADPRAARAPGSRTGGVPPMPGLPPIPEELLGRNGRLSIFKLVGWKGVALAVLVVAALIALAAVSFMVVLVAVPVLLLLGIVGWVVGKVRGPQPAAAGRRAVIVVRR